MRGMRRCEKLERDRQRKWRNTRQGAFEASFLHVDCGGDDSREDSPSWHSDKEAGVEAIVSACDGKADETLYRRTLRNARDRLRRSHPDLVEVFDLVVENGSNRKESIWALMRSKRSRRPEAAKVRYWTHLKKISLFFDVP